MDLELNGQVHASKDSLEFIDHQVLVSYVTQKGSDPNAGESGEISSKVLLDGSFSLVLPDNLIDGIVLEVISPDGEVLKSQKFTKNQISDNIVIDCDPKKYFSIPINNDPSLGKKLRITGKVLDEAGLQKISNKQVILYGFPKDRSEKDEEVILATTTDSEGYFTGVYPKDNNGPRKYSKAYGVVAAGIPQKITLTIEQDDLILRKIILVIKFPKQGSVEEPQDECESCKATVPRTPDVEDFVN